MLDIKKMAILLIYQDGTTDFVPIGEEEIHMPYFRKLRSLSPKFRTMTDGLDFSGTFHVKVDEFLVREGVIVLLNFSPCIKDFIDVLPPYFSVFLPNDYRSKEQKNTFFEIVRDYVKDWTWFSHYDKESNSFREGLEAKNYVLEDELISSQVIEGRK